VRCQQTVSQLANQLGLTVGVEPDLFEGAHAAATTLVKNLARNPEPGHVVLCSHGDVIPEILRDLTMDGVKLTGGRGCAKASLWALELDQNQIAGAHYSPTATDLIF